LSLVGVVATFKDILRIILRSFVNQALRQRPYAASFSLCHCGSTDVLPAAKSGKNLILADSGSGQA